MVNRLNIKNVMVKTINIGDEKKMDKEYCPSLKQSVSNNNKDEPILNAEHIPKYTTKKPEFSCPVSPHIMWHHGLIYKECPLDSNQRDMATCQKCCLKGNNTIKKKRKKSYKNKIKVERRKKEFIPKIRKTYVSE